MSLVDLYIKEIGRYLPVKKREDRQREIRERIDRLLDAASKAEGRPVDEKIEAEVLEQYGSPEVAAAAYGKVRYLIGPRLLPTFRLLVMAAIGLLAIISLANLEASLLRTAPDWLSIFRQISRQFLGAIYPAAAVLGGLTVVFALIQFFLSSQKPKGPSWDPHSLRRRSLLRGGEFEWRILESLVILLIIACLNYSPQWIGISMIQDGRWLHAPVLTASFFRFLPLVNLVLGAQVVRNLLPVKQDALSIFARLFSIGVDAASIGLVALLLDSGQLVAIYPAELTASGWGLSMAYAINRIVLVFSAFFRLSLIVSFIFQVIELFKNLRSIILSSNHLFKRI